MKIVKFGEKLPRFHGIVREDHMAQQSYTMLMPFNLIAMFVIFCINAVKFRIPIAVNEQPAMIYAAGYTKGYLEGVRDSAASQPAIPGEMLGERRVWLLEDQDGNRMFTEENERADKWRESLGESMTLTEFRQWKS